MLFGGGVCLFWKPYQEHIHTVGQNVEFLTVTGRGIRLPWILKISVEFGPLVSDNEYSTSENVEPFWCRVKIKKSHKN